MSLDFYFDGIDPEVQERNDRCWIEIDGKKQVAPVTEQVIFTCMAVGIGQITNDNADEFYARQAVWSKLHDCDPLKVDAIHDHIGLRTNVFPQETRLQWAKRVIIGTKGKSSVSVMDDLIRQYKRNEWREPVSQQADPYGALEPRNHGPGKNQRTSDDPWPL